MDGLIQATVQINEDIGRSISVIDHLEDLAVMRVEAAYLEEMERLREENQDLLEKNSRLLAHPPSYTSSATPMEMTAPIPIPPPNDNATVTQFPTLFDTPQTGALFGHFNEGDKGSGSEGFSEFFGADLFQ
jgi:hypothetical protein